jgi:hypothetical protein
MRHRWDALPISDLSVSKDLQKALPELQTIVDLDEAIAATRWFGAGSRPDCGAPWRRSIVACERCQRFLKFFVKNVYAWR